MQIRTNTPRPANYSSVTLSVTQGDACTPSVRTYLGPKPVRITRVTEENASRFKDSTSQSAFVCPVVSRRHALVTFSDTGAVYLTDTNSHHGTTIARTSDIRLTPTLLPATQPAHVAVEPGTRTKLEHGDIVTFGKTVVKDNIPHEPVVVRISISPGTPPTEPVKISPGRYGLFDSDDSSSESVSEDEHESDLDHEDEHEYDEDDSEGDGEDDCCEFAGEKPVVFCVDSDAASECDYGDASPSYYAVSGSPQQQAPSLPRFADFFGPSPSASGAHASAADRLSNESVQLTQAPPLPLLEPESESPLNPGFGQGSAEEKLYGSIGTKESVPPMQSETVQPRFPPPPPVTTSDSGMILPPVPSALLPQPPIRAPLPLYFNPVHMPPMPPMPMPPPHFVPLLSYAPPSFAPFEPIHNFDTLPVPMPVAQGYKPMNVPCGPPPGARYECGLQLRGGFHVPPIAPPLPPVLNNTGPEKCGVQPHVVIDVDAFKPDTDDADSGSDMDVGSDSEDDSDSDSNSDSNDDEESQSGMGGGQDPMAWANLRQTYGVSVERDESDSDAEGEEEEICIVSAPAPSPVVSIPVTPAIVPMLAPAPEPIPEPAPEPAPAPSVPEVAPVLIFECAPAPVAPQILPAPELPPVQALPEPVADVPLAVDVQALEDELARSRNEVLALRDALNAVQEQVRTLTAAPPSPEVTMAPSTPPRKRTLADLEADDTDAAPAPAPSLPPPRVKRRRIGLVASAAAGAVATYVGLAFF